MGWEGTTVLGWVNFGRFETRGLGGEHELIGSVEGRECTRQGQGVHARGECGGRGGKVCGLRGAADPLSAPTVGWEGTTFLGCDFF